MTRRLTRTLFALALLASALLSPAAANAATPTVAHGYGPPYHLSGMSATLTMPQGEPWWPHWRVRNPNQTVCYCVGVPGFVTWGQQNPPVDFSAVAGITEEGQVMAGPIPWIGLNPAIWTAGTWYLALNVPNGDGTFASQTITVTVTPPG